MFFSPEMHHTLNNGLYFGKNNLYLEHYVLFFAKGGANQCNPFTGFILL